MKQLVMMFEDLWVTITFAEAGESEPILINQSHPIYRESAAMRSA